MKIAYLILTHSNPRLLGRIVGALSSDDSDFFVHVDAKSDIRPFTEIRSAKVIFLKERVTVYWGEFSQVRAILSLIAEALSGPQRYEYFVLLSGSDYPLQTKEYIHHFIAARRGTEFIDMVNIPSVPAGRPLSLVNHYCVESARPFLRLAARILTRAGILRRDYRKHLGTLKPFGGETWWALTRGACEHIVEFVQSRPDVTQFFARAEVPDETFIHTILGNSKFSQRVRRNLLYRDWSGGGRHPAMVSAKHLEVFETNEKVILTDAFGSGEVLFARKFSDATLNLVDRIDHNLARKDRLALNDQGKLRILQ